MESDSKRTVGSTQKLGAHLQQPRSRSVSANSSPFKPNNNRVMFKELPKVYDEVNQQRQPLHKHIDLSSIVKKALGS